jgi:hypothetical protein
VCVCMGGCGCGHVWVCVCGRACVCLGVCVSVWVCGRGCVRVGEVVGVCLGECGCGMDAFLVFMTVLKCSLIGIQRHEYFIGNTQR